jgi:glutamate synthase domain-containing protein 3
MKRIDAAAMDSRRLNDAIHGALDAGVKALALDHVNGHRYICAGVKGEVRVEIEGIPGNDLGAFMDGPRIEVKGNGQDAIANTMNRGRIAVHGHAGDVLAYAMRGGELLVRDSVGYRVGIHMKAFRDLVPLIMVGGKARDFLGEYMAGGVIIVLALCGDGPPAGYGVGSGAHGGAIYVRGRLKPEQLGKEVRPVPFTGVDRALLARHVGDFCRTFGIGRPEEIVRSRFSKYAPVSHRPYGKLYAY